MKNSRLKSGWIVRDFFRSQPRTAESLKLFSGKNFSKVPKWEMITLQKTRQHDDSRWLESHLICVHRKNTTSNNGCKISIGHSSNACFFHGHLLGGGFNFFLFSPRSLGKIPILTNIFQMGWFNHQLVLGFFWGWASGELEVGVEPVMAGLRDWFIGKRSLNPPEN